MTTLSYLNDENNIVPDNKIIVVPHNTKEDSYHEEILESLVGNMKRDWFTPHFYYCLPLSIGNQYGYAVKSARTFEAIWKGGESFPEIKFLDESNGKQNISSHFGSGIITFQNRFALKTPPGVNLMTIQPPNMFIPGTVAMTGVVETDQIRRDFTFNLKITVPDYLVRVNAGDVIGAFIPIQRHWVENFKIEEISESFSEDVHINEKAEANRLGKERSTVDRLKPHTSGRRYFSGTHTDGSKYPDHQKKLV